VLGGALGAIWQNISAHNEAQIAEAAKKRDRELAEAAKERDRELAEAAKERDRELAEATKERDRKLERNDKLRAELASLVGTYNGVKAVRRTLRSLGFDPKYASSPPATTGRAHVLTPEQARGFREQMLILNGLQLDFESKARQFGQTDFLGDDTERVVTLLGGIENHLNQVLQVWEHNGSTIQEGTPIDVVANGLSKLFRVREHLRPQVSDPLREITRLINKHVFGEATAKTQRAFQGVVSVHVNREPDEDGGER
jgi:hypothetical protein